MAKMEKGDLEDTNDEDHSCVVGIDVNYLQASMLFQQHTNPIATASSL